MAHLVPLIGLLATGTAAPVEDSAFIDDSPAETAVLAGPGVVSGQTMAGAAVSFIAMHRWRWLELGADVEAAGLIAGQLGWGGMAGLHLGDDFSLRLLGSAGWHAYGGVGGALLSDDPGVSGRTPYVGGRLLLGHSLERRAGTNHRGFFGILTALDDDLSRTTKSVTYRHESWFGGGPTETTASHTVGQLTFAAYFVAGVELDLADY